MSTWGACHTWWMLRESLSADGPGCTGCPGRFINLRVFNPGNGSWTDYTCVTLTAEIDATNYILKGWKLSAGQKLPTFTTSRPRLTPGNEPAGLWQCEPLEVERWVNDLHRFPPYVYRDKHCLQNAHGEHRLPTIQEKEVATGFPVDYTANCLPKGQQKGPGYVDVRHTL